jgi:hypothetical protein
MPTRLDWMKKGLMSLHYFPNVLRPLVFLTTLGASNLLFCAHASAGDASVQFEYSVLHDANFLRAQNAQEETISLAAMGLIGELNVSKQQLKAALKFNQLNYEINQDLNSSYILGGVDWQGQIGKKILIDAVISRDAYAVDPLEYQKKDIVSKNEFLARVGYGTRENLSFWMGGSEVDQTHSAIEREILDFEQQALFVEMVALNGRGLEHRLKFAEGERRYKTGLSSLGEAIDFDYRQASYEVIWVKNTTNQLSLGVVRFDRQGEVNNDTGMLWNSKWLWQVTPKVSMRLGFELNEPAAGEEIETPSKLKDSNVALRWQIASHWALETNFLHSKQKYITQLTLVERDEIWERWRPLVIAYSSGDRFSARLETELYKRQSNTGFRDYEGEKINLTLMLHF